MAQQFLRITAEETSGVFDTASPAFQFFVDLEEGNPFTMRKEPDKLVTAGYGAKNLKRLRTGERYKVSGSLKTRAYWEQLPHFINLALVRKSSNSLPWTNSNSFVTGDLLSATVDHAIRYADGTTYQIDRYTGVKVKKFELSGTNEAKSEFMLNLDLEGLKVERLASNAIAVPALSAYPTNPVMFYHLCGDFDGSLSFNNPVTNFSSLSIGIENVLDVNFDECPHPVRISYKGHSCMLNWRGLFKTPGGTILDYRNALNGDTPYEAIVALSDAATKICTFTFPRAFVNKVGEDLDPGKDFYLNIETEGYLDPTAGDSYSVTVEDVP